MPYQYLKDRQYYEDLYDEITVEECRWYEEHGKKKIEDAVPEKKSWEKFIMDISLWGVSGERYERKSETINEWMERDRLRDEQVEKAITPSRVLCLSCGIYMDFEMKHLHTEHTKSKDRVLFMFRCKECRKGRALFEGGEEWKLEHRCPKCGTDFTATHREEGRKAITDYFCGNCGETDRYILDLDEKPQKSDEAEVRRFRIDRERFCDEKKGREYVDQKFCIKQLEGLMDNLRYREEHKELYDAAAALKKVSLMTMEKMLGTALKKKGYLRLKLGTPSMGRDVIAEFTVQDEKERNEYDSRTTLKKVIETALKDTNWKLMTEGATYRLGVLSGRLKGVESEEDLVKLAESRRKS